MTNELLNRRTLPGFEHIKVYHRRNPNYINKSCDNPDYESIDYSLDANKMVNDIVGKRRYDHETYPNPDYESIDYILDANKMVNDIVGEDGGIRRNKRRSVKKSKRRSKIN